jgi:hypothetical protein
MSKHLPIAAALAILLLAAVAAPTIAQQPPASSHPNAASILDQMARAVDPPVPSVRVMNLTITTGRSSTRHLKLAQARAHVDSSDRVLTVVLSSPPEGQGIAFLDEKTSPAASVQFIYVPATKRVHKFAPLEAWNPFFGSDFTYHDFSFTHSAANVKLEETGTRGGVKSYKLEEVLPNNPHYSKIISWIAVDSELPVERNYYDLSGKLYKVERFERITTVQGIPTIMKTVMNNVQQGSSSELDVTSIHYHQSAPQKLFDPAYLSQVAADQFWKTLTH